MNGLVYIFALMVAGRAAAELVDLNCSDNATCIDNMTKDLVRSLRQQKAVRLFEILTIEPLGRPRQARSNQGLLSRFMENHAFSFDWNDFSFRLLKPQERNDAVELEVYEGRAAKDVAGVEPVTKKSSSKVEKSDDEEKGAKRLRNRRHRRRKVLQALIPMMFGMKSAGTVIFAMAVVTALTMKAFIASKLALVVTVGMALKRLYESYSNGIPATSNVLWNIARYFRVLFGIPGLPSLNAAQTMPVPMYHIPMQQVQMPQMQQMYVPSMPAQTA